MKSATQVISEFMCNLSFDKIPKEVVDTIKNCVLDSVGNILGGLNTSETKAIRSAVMVDGECGGATILGIGKKVSVANAALVNTATHEGLDFTAAGADTGVETNTIPVALAVGEKERVDGKALITAITAGIETQWRIAMAFDSKGSAFKQKGFYASGVAGPWGSVATASKIVNLDKDQTTMALGLAGSQALGPIYCAYRGTVREKVLFMGMGAYTGVMATYMAKAGLKSPVDIIEADGGFLSCFSDLSKVDMATWKLREEYMSKYICYKLYPCCRYTHPYIDAALNIRRQHNVKPEDIAKITAYVPPEVYSATLKDWRPTEAMHAQFHLGWTVAAALIDGGVTIDTYEEERLDDPEIWELAQKVEYVEDSKLKARFKYTEFPPFTVPGDLAIRMKDGNEYLEKIDQPRGVATTTYEDIYEKFEKQARKVLPNDRVKKIAETCRNLEQLRDVGDLVKLTTP